MLSFERKGSFMRKGVLDWHCNSDGDSDGKGDSNGGEGVPDGGKDSSNGGNVQMVVLTTLTSGTDVVSMDVVHNIMVTPVLMVFLNFWT